MLWFTKDAPIRLKLFIAFGAMCGLVALAPLTALVAPTWIFTVGLVATGMAIALAIWFRSAIATPYVSTVVRMEALAAGDLTSPIAFTDFQDCVGRMTRAMLSFRDAARKQIALNEEAHKHAGIVRGMTANLGRLADGDLTAEITEDYPGDYAELRARFNAALASLRALIGTVNEGAAVIHTGADEIAQASENLARRTQANAASLEQTSAAVAQMDQRLKATAEAAGRTVARADGTIATVSGGRTITDEAVQAMTRVSESARGIDSVIEGLDKIAFQTRVLAMNAAVEAGRAGEAGRGFAVVADLVSALAMRAEEEAGRARDQLTTTQSEVVAAVEMVQKVDGALADISSDVAEVHALLGQIAGDNQAQATAISEISGAIATMDQSTQQNAAMVEQTSAAARSLSGEVADLAAHAARFTVDDNRAANGRRSAAAPVRGMASATRH